MDSLQVTLLGANETFDSKWIDRLQQGVFAKGIKLAVFSSSAGTLKILESDDAGTGTELYSGSVTANTYLESSVASFTKRYYKVQFINGASAQTKFLLYDIVYPSSDVSLSVDGLEGYVDGVETKLDTIAGYVDGLETKLDTISGYLNNTRKSASDIITFDAGAGAHSAGDVVSTTSGEILEFNTGLAAGGSGQILSSLFHLNQSSIFSGHTGYKLYLFTVTPTIQATNAAFNLATAELSSYIGPLDISPLTDLGDNCAIFDNNHALDFTLAPADTKLYGKLVCKGAETTVENKVLTIKLGILSL